MYCTDCGSKIPADAKFCPNCGVSLDETAKPSVQRHEPQINSTTEKPKMATWKKVLIGIVSFIVFIVALSLMVTSDLQELTDAHLAALRSGDLETAYSHTSPQFRKATPPQKFQQFVAAYPVLTKHTEYLFESRGFENNTGYVKGHLADNGKKLAKIEFQLIKVGDNWTIQGFNLKAPE